MRRAQAMHRRYLDLEAAIDEWHGEALHARHVHLFAALVATLVAVAVFFVVL